MKKIIAVFGLLSMIILSGCSLIEDVNHSLDYVNKGTDYIHTTQSFANELPTLAQDAIANKEAREDLESKLQAMKEEIQAFNEIEAPSIASDIHNSIVSSNKKLEEGIDLYLSHIENGTFDTDLLENSEIMTTITELNELKNQIEELGL
ncbi:DUF6376 family protein [Lederbergia lenta]|uniref:Putative lipoprotein n=1 Tax=Lederbergia lenta TaxID=1467 RepID=A0A2X4YTP6_LEDLE|nr:DUF6376 family protein [Lederbergia lenta]MCM3112622.1 DUF6376 family protein [Lederbergia lenta]MEC2323660.1 DUF6376 family protein [Lederbergia lenta]SQI51684.1 putative lipoprotein [Lederbergia lenta]